MSGDDPIADWRGRLEEHNRASEEVRRAEALLATALETPGEIGAELARRRLAAAQKQAARVNYRLTGGRPIDQAIWSLPDDL